MTGRDPLLVWVRFVPDAGDRAADHRALTDLAAHALGLPREPLQLHHRCPHCGSSTHGRPHIERPGAQGADARSTAVSVNVSLSRAGGIVALAAAAGSTALGIDIESIDRVQQASFDDVAFNPHEQAELRAADSPTTADRMRLSGWTAKEALLKATGTGLRTDPKSLRLTWPPTPPGPTPTNTATGTHVDLLDSTLPAVHPSTTRLTTLYGPAVLATIALLTRRPARIHLL